MNSDCDRIKDRIAELISGTGEANDRTEVQEHLLRCSKCRAYADEFEEEERHLTGFFTRFDSGISRVETAVVNALEGAELPVRGGSVAFGRTLIGAALAKHGLAAAVLVVVTVYFVITLNWIYQINECIRLSM